MTSPIAHKHLVKAFSDAGYNVLPMDDNKFYVDIGERLVAWHVINDVVDTMEGCTFTPITTVFDAIDHLNSSRLSTLKS